MTNSELYFLLLCQNKEVTFRTSSPECFPILSKQNEVFNIFEFSLKKNSFWARGNESFKYYIMNLFKGSRYQVTFILLFVFSHVFQNFIINMCSFCIRKKFNGRTNKIILRRELHQDKMRVDEYLGTWCV